MTMMHQNTGILVLLAIVAVAAGGCATDAVSGGVEEILVDDEDIHSRIGCAIKNLGPGNAAAAVASRYGNWCGANLWGDANDANGLGDQNGDNPQPPVNCWDAACRIHDYEFGRPIDGFRSCHAVFFDELLFSRSRHVATACVEAADHDLCERWDQCSDDARRTERDTRGTWVWRPVQGTKQVVQERVCQGDPSRKPTTCSWVSQPGDEVYTCDTTLCPPVPPLAPVPSQPASGCAVSYDPPPSRDAAADLAECCSFPLVGNRPEECSVCTPTTCIETGATCGSISNGCGGTLDCGTCVAPETCGGGGVPDECGCTPTTCAAAGATCGTIPDACKGTLDCGMCSPPETCEGGGIPNQCGSTDATLLVHRTGAASNAGIVNSAPDNRIDCGARCQVDFAAGETVTLNAAVSPDSGAVFTGWGGGCTRFGTISSGSLTLVTDTTCTATFECPDGSTWDQATQSCTWQLVVCKAGVGEGTVAVRSRGLVLTDGAIIPYSFDRDLQFSTTQNCQVIDGMPQRLELALSSGATGDSVALGFQGSIENGCFNFDASGACLTRADTEFPTVVAALFGRSPALTLSFAVENGRFYGVRLQEVGGTLIRAGAAPVQFVFDTLPEPCPGCTPAQGFQVIFCNPGFNEDIWVDWRGEFYGEDLGTTSTQLPGAGQCTGRFFSTSLDACGRFSDYDCHFCGCGCSGQDCGCTTETTETGELRVCI